MAFMLSEMAKTFAALAILSLVIISSGLFFARLLRFPGFERSQFWERCSLGLLCGFAVMPVLMDWIGRAGPVPMTAAALLFAIAGIAGLSGTRTGEATRPAWILFAAIWIIVAAFALVDAPDASGGLAHSLLAIDYVKHAATTWAIADDGTPPFNPTYHDPGRPASYYYLYYTLTAAASVIAESLGLHARHVAYGGGILAGFAIYALAGLAWRRAECDEAMGVPPGTPWRAWLLALLFASGLGIVPALTFNSVRGGDFWSAPIAGWAERVSSWIGSALWVPHHVAALCAAFVGFLALARPATGHDARRITLAALAFASATGQSVYIGIGAALAAGLWLIVLITARRWKDALHLVAAGLLAGALLSPWLLTLKSVAAAGPPLRIYIRGPAWLYSLFDDGPTAYVISALTFVPVYLIQFGVFGIGSWAFWRVAGRRAWSTDVRLILILCAGSAFLLGSFVRSTVLQNDLGWRIMLFGQLATCVWTLSAIRSDALIRVGALRLFQACLALGFCSSAYEILQFRFIPSRAMLETATEHVALADEIAAWTWLDDKLPAGSVVQFRPKVGDIYSPERAYSYGLYGHFPAAVADGHNGRLFGASAAQVESRIQLLLPIFNDASSSADDVRQIAQALDISAIVVTSADPVYAHPRSWATSSCAVFANAHVRIYFTATLARPSCRSERVADTAS